MLKEFGEFKMDIRKIKKIASELLGVGETRVWIEPTKVLEIVKCITKDDIRGKIKEGAIRKSNSAYASRSRARARQKKKRLGRKRGFGKRKGSRKARSEQRKSWISNVRAQRKKIKELREKGAIDQKTYSKLYKMVKGNYFKGKKYIEAFIK